jgi:hypothetical protein
MTFKKNVVATVLLVLALIVGVSGYFLNKKMENITISNSTIQNAIDKKIPLVKDIPMGQVVVNHAAVKLNDTINIDLNGSVKVMDKNFNYTANATGTIIYKSGNFYFKPDDLKLNVLKDTTAAETPSIKSKLFDKMKSKVSDLGIDSKMINTELNRIILDNFENIPLYKLKTGVVKASLENVTIKDDNLIIQMSLIKLLGSIFLYIGFVVVSLLVVVALFMSGPIVFGAWMLI